MLLVASVVLLIGAAVLGVDKGVLSHMATAEYARGLITYLFAVVTIGTAVVLVLSALIGTADEAHDKQFQRGKEVLSLLLGVFGTIVGFYFGSANGAAGNFPLRLSRIDLNPPAVQVGDTVTARAFVVGGTGPYQFALGLGTGKLDPTESVPESGLITKQFTMQPAQSSDTVVHLVVEDSIGKRAEQTATLELKSK